MASYTKNDEVIAMDTEADNFNFKKTDINDEDYIYILDDEIEKDTEIQNRNKYKYIKKHNIIFTDLIRDKYIILDESNISKLTDTQIEHRINKIIELSGPYTYKSYDFTRLINGIKNYVSNIGKPNVTNNMFYSVVNDYKREIRTVYITSLYANVLLGVKTDFDIAYINEIYNLSVKLFNYTIYDDFSNFKSSAIRLRYYLSKCIYNFNTQKNKKSITYKEFMTQHTKPQKNNLQKKVNHNTKHFKNEMQKQNVPILPPQYTSYIKQKKICDNKKKYTNTHIKKK